jgi:hypothetical protein
MWLNQMNFDVNAEENVKLAIIFKIKTNLLTVPFHQRKLAWLDSKSAAQQGQMDSETKTKQTTKLILLLCQLLHNEKESKLEL